MATSQAAARPGSLRNKRFSAALPPLTHQVMNLLNLRGTGRSIAPGRELVTEGRPCLTLFLISEGVAIRYRILRNGQRQIIDVLLPGNFAGITSCRFETALFSIRTLTHALVHPIPLPRLASLIESQPQLASQLFSSFAKDTAVLAERLIAIGRRSAPERVAHFLLELLTRLRQLEMVEGDAFRLPLTQEIIGDALGLSLPYVNRVLHLLQDEGLVLIKNQRFEIPNIEELAAFADFRRDYLEPRPVAEPNQI